MAEQNDRPRARRRKSGEWSRVVGELDRENHASAFALCRDPFELRPVKPVDVRPTRQRIAAAERRSIVLRIGNSHARTDRIACPEQRSEVGVVRNPKRSDDEVIPAAVLANASLAPQVSRSGLRARSHATGGLLLSTLMTRRTLMVFWVGVIGVIVWLVLRAGHGGVGGSRPARRILDERYARGEIDTDDYEARLEKLR